MSTSTISLRDIEIWTRIGVPGEERAMEQRILLTVTMECAGGAGATDRLEDTADYEEVTRTIKRLAKTERKTIERFAEDIAQGVLKQQKVKKVNVELKKFVLPGTRAVIIRIERP